MSNRTIQWYIDCIIEASNANTVLKVWREAEEYLEVSELVRIHAVCGNKIVKSIREVKNG